MRHMKWTVISSLMVAASPVLAQGPERDPAAGAPAAGPDARYCMRVEAHTGTRVERVHCWTRRRWAEEGVDLDKEWAREGVTVIG